MTEQNNVKHVPAVHLQAESNRMDTGSDEEKVGYCKPPKKYRFQKGQSGCPRGRPKGQRNRKTILKEIFGQTYTITIGNSRKKMDMLGANLLAHGLKGAKGDARSFNAFMKAAEKLGLLDEPISDTNLQAARGPAMTSPMEESYPSDVLFENFDRNLLRREEQIELSELIEIFDHKGDVTALTVANFERLKAMIEKGRGKPPT